MTTTPGDDASPDTSSADRDGHDTSDADGIDDGQLPEDLQPSEDNPLAAPPDESPDSDGVSGSGGEPPD
ncbi:MAG: hypothetical protein M3Q82_06510 [Actinomycetota bacterium]|nr:hypothetical protein [Actinomycetota bacterium]